MVIGELSEHARGKTLAKAFDAAAGQELPDSGAVFVFGRQLQRDTEAASSWLSWVAIPGRLLVVVPPFERALCSVPVEWEAKRVESLAGGETALGKLLAGERRHELRGQLLPFERAAGHVVTAGWRKHPNAGLLVLTTLPLWSLTTLDHKSDCKSWLDDLVSQAGRTPEKAPEQPTHEAHAMRDLVQEEWTMMLHLCTGSYASDEDALLALEKSQLHQLEPTSAKQALEELEGLGLVAAGSLTGQGKELLLGSRYATFARALWRQHGNA
jgi:hypothetical protein